MNKTEKMIEPKECRDDYKEGHTQAIKKVLEIIDKELKLENTMTNDKTKIWINGTLKRIKAQMEKLK